MTYKCARKRNLELIFEKENEVLRLTMKFIIVKKFLKILTMLTHQKIYIGHHISFI